MTFHRIADARIRDAIREGKFEGLRKDGPIDLEGYFKLPAELRMAYSVLKSAGCVPEEVELLREIERLETELAAATDAGRCAHLRRDRDAARLKLDVALERAARQRRRYDGPSAL